MSLNLDALGPDIIVDDEYDSSSSSDSTPRNSLNPSPSNGYAQYDGPSHASIGNYLSPSLSRNVRVSRYGSSSSSASDTEDEPGSPFLRSSHRRRARGIPNWWTPPVRRRPSEYRFWRPVRRFLRQVVRLPFFPSRPLTIVLSLVLFCTFAVLLTLFLMYILNPDKEPLAWRAYCSVPPASLPPSYIHAPTSSTLRVPESALTVIHPEFPPPNFDQLPPAGVFVGVFSMDSSFERRMLIRTTYASHSRSRDGAGEGDGGQGTSRTVVRFVIGLPRKDWDRRIRLEMETYNDLIILPVQENMNDGKSHSFFTWTAAHAWVPPLYSNNSIRPSYSYSDETNPPPPLAPHDPILAHQDAAASRSPQPWVRPDFIVKVDDDAFIMLAELEGRLRHELHLQPITNSTSPPPPPVSYSKAIHDDPLIYWGYMVANRLHRFMAGEMYALSWKLVTWVASDPVVRTMTQGAEDKQTSKWMRLHPRAADIRWSSERCWIYDHPRAGSVYAHGFLFPSERTRVKASIMDYPEKTPLDQPPTAAISLAGNEAQMPLAWTRSSVATFRSRYDPPITDLSTRHSIEAMVEGSAMSKLRHGAPSTPEYAWSTREGRRKQYENKRLGGTIVVHFVKKHMWFIETALSLLEGDEFTEAEKLMWREEQRHVSDPPLADNETTAHRIIQRRRKRL